MGPNNAPSMLGVDPICCFSGAQTVIDYKIFNRNSDSSGIVADAVQNVRDARVTFDNQSTTCVFTRDLTSVDVLNDLSISFNQRNIFVWAFGPLQNTNTNITNFLTGGGFHGAGNAGAFNWNPNSASTVSASILAVLITILAAVIVA